MPERTMPFTVRSEAEFGSGDARRVAAPPAGGIHDGSWTPMSPPPTRGVQWVIVRKRRRPAALGVAVAL